MALQPGKGVGVSNLINFKVDGIASDSYIYNIVVEGWNWGLSHETIDRTGPALRPNTRLENQRNSWSFKGKVQNQAYPFPTLTQYARGTLTLTENTISSATGNYATNVVNLAGKVTGLSISRDEKTQDDWDIKGTFIADGAATINWNGTQAIISAATAQYYDTDTGTKWKYDPNFLQTAAVTRVDVSGISDNDSSNVAAMSTWIASELATPPQANLVPTTSEFTRTGSGGGFFYVGWALRNTDDNLNYPATSSYRASQRPYTDSIAYTVDAGTTNTATQSNLIWADVQDEPFILGVRVRPVTQTKRQVVKTYLNPDVYLKGRGRKATKVNYRLISGVPYLYVATNQTYGTNQLLVQLSYTDNIAVGREILEYVVVRHLTGTVVPRQNPDTIFGQTLPYYYTTNLTSFLGNSSGTTLYTGMAFTINAALSGNAPIVAGYDFRHDSEGIVLGINDLWFNRPIICNGTNSATGWVTAASLGAPFTSVFVPTSNSFTAFTTLS